LPQKGSEAGGRCANQPTDKRPQDYGKRTLKNVGPVGPTQDCLQIDQDLRGLPRSGKPSGSARRRAAQLRRHAERSDDALAGNSRLSGSGWCPPHAETSRLRAESNQAVPVVETGARLAARYNALVANLAESLGTDPDRGRAALRELSGPIVVEPRPDRNLFNRQHRNKRKDPDASGNRVSDSDGSGGRIARLSADCSARLSDAS
jgi:hypothetical protein